MTSIAQRMASKQREISVSEFFAKNRHLLGFDNPKRALLTTIKEAVDNSLDACEEARILPDLEIKITQVSEDDRYTVEVSDNGPGIIKSQIPKIFGKLLYGSKFHSLKMSRGQQGIGISAAGLYGQITTGKPIIIISKTKRSKLAHLYKIQINTQKNMPEIVEEDMVEIESKHGTKVKLELEAKVTGGKQSVEEYLFQTVVANPHISLKYTDPKGEEVFYERATNVMPAETLEIKPHPYGVELGVLMKLLRTTKSKKIISFLTNDFCRVGRTIAKRILDKAGISDSAWTKRIAREEAENLYKAINSTKIMAPPTDCITPIREEEMIKGLKKLFNADFYTAVTRKAYVYRGNPFQVEMAAAYGGELRTDDSVEILRFANRVPLLYQKSACCMTQAVQATNWKAYGLNQSRNSLPTGPAVIMIHIASVWVPFTSESKEAIASYPEIEKELKLLAQECGRKLHRHVRKVVKIKEAIKKRSYMEKYVRHIGLALQEILNINDKKVDEINDSLYNILERSTQV